jgi:hypothetical protein
MRNRILKGILVRKIKSNKKRRVEKARKPKKRGNVDEYSVWKSNRNRSGNLDRAKRAILIGRGRRRKK